MKKFLQAVTAIALTVAICFMPSVASAHSGAIDEYDGHYYHSDGVHTYSLDEGEYHYHPQVFVYDYEWRYMADDEVFRPFMTTDLITFVALESFDISNNDSGFYTETRFRPDGVIEKWISKWDSDVKVSFYDQQTMLVETETGVVEKPLTNMNKVQLVDGHYFVPIDTIIPEFGGGLYCLIDGGTRTQVYAVY